MAYVVKRNGRYTGYYRFNGKRVSAGTFDTHKQAMKAAFLAEDEYPHDAVDMVFEEYIKVWLPRAECLPITQKGYEAVLRNHVLPLIGAKKVSQITKSVVREVLDELRVRGVGNATIVQCKAAIGAAFRPLVESEKVGTNPTHGIRVKHNTAPITHVVTEEEFQGIISALPESARLFAKFLVTSGARFGEATELRVKDINSASNEIYIQRRVSEIGKKRNNGQRFLVIDATKSGHRRSLVLNAAMMQEIKQYIENNSLGVEDLLFSKGSVLKSGKLEAHLPRDMWRTVWKEAIVKSGIGWMPRTHDLRHANATSLLKNGVDVHEVKERLGHRSIRTTERYLHRLRSQQSKAAEAVGGYLE